MKPVHAAVVVILVATGLTPSAVAAGRKKPRYDPDQVICESRNMIGSRLQRVRVCHTAQEWEEVRTQEKVGLMRRQFNGASGAGSADSRDSPR